MVNQPQTAMWKMEIQYVSNLITRDHDKHFNKHMYQNAFYSFLRQQ